MNIYIINGPPRAGKDQLAKFIRFTLHALEEDCEILKFAKPLDDMAKAILPEHIVDDYDSWRETKKDVVFNSQGATVRKVLIGVSENLVKPLLGKTYFAEKAVDMIQNTRHIDNVVFSDSGFQTEFDHFVDHMAPDHKVLLIRLERAGKGFQGDSRNFISSRGKCSETTVQNNGSLSELKAKAQMLVVKMEEMK